MTLIPGVSPQVFALGQVGAHDFQPRRSALHAFEQSANKITRSSHLLLSLGTKKYINVFTHILHTFG